MFFVYWFTGFLLCGALPFLRFSVGGNSWDEFW